MSHNDSELFKPGECVVWKKSQEDKSDKKFVESLERIYGSGPFEVVEIEPKRNGHPQILHVKMGKDRQPISGHFLMHLLH